MATKSVEEKQADTYGQVVREALERLCSFEAEPSSRSRVRPFEFSVKGEEGKKLRLPTDDDAPFDDSIEGYIVKEMEFVQSILVAERLAKRLDLMPMRPGTFDPAKYVELVLDTVGRGTGEERATEEKRYYPRPHLAMSLDVPFVDFAGFLTVLLSDFVAWCGNVDTPVKRAARAEIDTAIEFILSSDTFISDDKGTGWGFLAKEHSDSKKLALPKHRHVLPTAWAVVALEKYTQLSDCSEDVNAQIDKLLPRVLDWLTSLKQSSGIFAADERKQQINLAGHNYATEALLTLEELKVPGAKAVTVAAIDYFVAALRVPEASDNFEVNIGYSIFMKGKPLIAYPDRTTWANCLSTLALAVDLLTRNPNEDVGGRLSEARSLCEEMARNVAVERRDPNSGLWQRTSLQFHWVMTAVESLLRFSAYAKTQSFTTSADAVIKAVGHVLEDPEFGNSLRDAMLRALAVTSKSVVVENEDESGIAKDDDG